MSDWPFFSEVDERMDPDFMARLTELRIEANFPFPVTSSYRDSEHNRRVGGSPNSAHLLGRAVDIRVSGERAFKLLNLAPRFGFTGIGVKQKGSKRFIHLDDCEDSPERPRPRVWSY